MTKHKPPNSVGIREIVRFWPLMIVVTLITVGAAIWSESRKDPSYTATTRLMVIPLIQSDETFLGTSLVRDAGDATLTAGTVAAQLNSHRAATVTADYLGRGWTPDAVAAAVKVSAHGNTNLIDIVARSADASKATKLAEGFAAATLADRWKTISGELEDRIDAITNDSDDTMVGRGAGTPGDSNAGEAFTRLQTLKMVRDAGSDPTLRIDSTSPAVRSKQLPTWVIMGLATVGGLFVGLLAAVGVAMLRSRMNQPADKSVVQPLNPAQSPNGERPTDAEALVHAYPRPPDTEP
jgi:capsular polysaccharide biosynthesis protein